jgi:predicted TIM-barrel fold metal-dependent hydrolase
MEAKARFDALDGLAVAFRQEQSRRTYDLLKGTRFEEEFNRLKEIERRAPVAPKILGHGAPLDETSIARAMQAGRVSNRGTDCALQLDRAQFPYADGALAFVGYMLSYRWMSLIEYMKAFTTDDDAFGVDQAVGALVDFDHWLECPLRSPHEDQIAVHELLSELSDGFMRPLVAYNPWSDVLLRGKVLDRVIDAVSNRGFVGVKIYPPNGFMPLGNDRNPVPPLYGQPSYDQIEQALDRFWATIAELSVPVMAHTSESMGNDEAYDRLGGPDGWKTLAKRFNETSPAPTVSLGHFGGAAPGNDWPNEFADLMAPKLEGVRFYADLGYWELLRCRGGDQRARGAAIKRLETAVRRTGGQERFMYGSDWLMLSLEPAWPDYPFEVAEATAGFLDPEELFGGNARGCFSRV